jgi:hypothetical protein
MRVWILGSALASALCGSAAHAADTLPRNMLGRWATDLAACAEQASEIVMKVEPRMVLFYEHGYEIKRIARLKDGSLKASGYSVDDDVRARSSITLKLLSADQIQVQGEQIYRRCK